MVWIKRGKARNITEVIKEISRLTITEVASAPVVPPSSIVGMEEAADMVLQAIQERQQITVFGDYDADGITATAILWHLLRYLGSTPHTRLPRRYSEGYGLSMKGVEEINEGVILTVDNGIAAVEQIRKAKDKGLTVIILDHHLPSDELPQADVIVDPHIAPEQSGFSEYCGAGLAYKLVQLLVEDKEFLKRMSALAAIGTIADVVPLIGDNRLIAREGLKAINRHDVTPGLLALLNVVGLSEVDEQSIGYTIGPMLNAAGRLLDDGAEHPLEMLITEDYAKAEERAYALIEMNNQRKDLLSQAMNRAHEILKNSGSEEHNPICIFDPELLAGLAGLVAGRLAEEYRTPAIVLTKSNKPGELKGSGRSYGGVHLKNLLDGANQHLSKYGGHAGAAGLSLPETELASFTLQLEKLMRDYTRPDNDTVYYDLEITLPNVANTIADLKRYAPFGEGNPRPVIRINQILLLPQAGKVYRTMGDNGEHLRLLGKDISVVAFNMTEEYMRQGQPDVINVLGYLSQTKFMMNERIELEAISFEKGESDEKKDTDLKKQMLLHLLEFADGRR